MRVNGMFSAGHDGMLGDAVLFEQFEVDETAELLACQRAAVEIKTALSNHGAAQHFDSQIKGFLDFSDGSADRTDFRGAFDETFRKKRFRPADEVYPLLPQAFGIFEGEISGYRDLTDAFRLEKTGNEVRITGTAAVTFYKVTGQRRGRKHLMGVGLAAGAVDFQIAHDENFASAYLHEDKRVRGNKAGGVIHISVMFAFGDHEQAFIFRFVRQGGSPSGDSCCIIHEVSTRSRTAKNQGEGMAEFVKVALRSEIPAGEGKLVEVDGREIALFIHEGRVVALDNICPHQGGPLSEGGITEEGFVTCPWHGWEFSAKDGACGFNPSIKVPVYEVREEGDDVLIRL